MRSCGNDGCDLQTEKKYQENERRSTCWHGMSFSHQTVSHKDLPTRPLRCFTSGKKGRETYQNYLFANLVELPLGTSKALPHKLGVHCQRGHKPDSPNQAVTAGPLGLGHRVKTGSDALVSSSTARSP